MTVSEQWRAKPTRFMWNRLTSDEQWAEVERLQAEAEIEQLQEELNRYRVALIEIRQRQGRVCDKFETCTHIGCESSYASWAIADETLQVEGLVGESFHDAP